MKPIRSYKVSHTESNITQRTAQSGETYLTGTVTTPHGYVIVYSDPGSEGGPGNTRLDFVYKGRHWICEMREGSSTRALARKAARFADQIASMAKDSA